MNGLMGSSRKTSTPKPVELVAVGAALTLYGTGVLDLPSRSPGSATPR